MKNVRAISLFLLVFISLLIKGQNLVPNPGFEKYLSCPDNPDQLSNCLYWSSYRETPDYYNECGQISGFCVVPPNCFNGFQYPHSGSAFAGLATFGFPAFFREIIGNQLLSPLLVEQKYFISFYINLGGESHATIAADKMGIKFSTVSYSASNPAPIDNTVHFYCDFIITDTLNWVKISGSFIADSAYTYIMIGNFFDDAHTDTINLSTINTYAYYYIDDVCVSTDSLCCANWTGIEENNADKKEKVEVYPNPAYNNITISSLNHENISAYTISDLTGRIITNRSIVMLSDKVIADISALATGTYFINVLTEKCSYKFKFVKAK